MAKIPVVASQPQASDDEQPSNSSSCSASVEELLADIDDLEKEQGDNEEVQKLVRQAKSVRAWDAYIAQLAHPTKWRTAVAPPPPQRT